MKRSASLVLALMLVGSAAPARAALPTPESIPTGNRIFVGGGTPLTNGIFFPGTAICEDDGCEYLGPIPQIERKTNITLVNLDSSEVANAHSMVSIKTNKRGRPLFASRDHRGPGTMEVKTKKLKPGIYEYFCRTHFGMYGAFEVVKPQ